MPQEDLPTFLKVAERLQVKLVLKPLRDTFFILADNFR